MFKVKPQMLMTCPMCTEQTCKHAKMWFAKESLNINYKQYTVLFNALLNENHFYFIQPEARGNRIDKYLFSFNVTVREEKILKTAYFEILKSVLFRESVV